MTLRKRWYEYIPHPVIMLFLIIVLTVILSYVLPAGNFERELMDGRQKVIPGSYKLTDPSPVGLMGMFKALPLGFKAAAEIIFVVLASGIMFGVLDATKMVENTVGATVKKLGLERRKLMVVLMTFVYGLLGILVGYETNIALIPIAAVMILAVGGDLMLAAGVSVAAVTVGFGLSPINPYTVGVGHKIAEMPLFSGMALRSILCFIGLGLLAYYNLKYLKKISEDANLSYTKGIDTAGLKLSKPLETYQISPNNCLVLSIFLGGLGLMLYGVFEWGWFFNEISAMFIIISILSGLAARMNGTELGETVLKSVAVVAPGAFMVGYANSIRILMEMGNISDTIAYHLSEVLTYLPTYASAVAMSMAQSIINLLIPSGSGQALATLPIMIPLGEILGLTRQTTILAFQIGDGVTNLFNPALGGLIAMLGMCRVPFDKWLRFIFPIVGIILLVSWLFLLLSVAINWGPV